MLLFAFTDAGRSDSMEIFFLASSIFDFDNCFGSSNEIEV